MQKRNPELKTAYNSGIAIQSYAEAVGDITKKYKTITISGSHGKSTTTALVALVLEDGYFDPMVIAGTKIKDFQDSNFRPGIGGVFVLEADEWNKSFLNFYPQIAIVTNIDAEHLDTYKNTEAIEQAFYEFLKRVPEYGVIIANADDARTRRVAEKFGKKVHWYSLKDPAADVVRKVLRVPGEHNVSNALAALTLGHVLGISEPHILQALSRFHGCWRRFELKGLLNGAYIFTDYGHHPTEIKTTIAAARHRFPMRRIWCVYQPHQFRRLFYLWDNFLSAFDMADRVGLLPVYDVAGIEDMHAKSTVSSLKLSHEIAKLGKNVVHLANFQKAKKYLKTETRAGDIVLVMGAGDIYNLAKELC